MSTIQIVKLSEEFNAQYQDAVGISYEELLDKVTDGYISLWESKYAGHPDLDSMKKDEGINVTTARANIAAFCASDTAEADPLQAGNNKNMYIAIDKDTENVVGLIQLSDFDYTKFQKKRPRPLRSLRDAAAKHMSPESLSKGRAYTASVFAQVCKPQREYYAERAIGDVLMREALANSSQTCAFIVSYGGEETEIGYENVAKTTTMDSEGKTPCFFMLGKNSAVIEKLDERLTAYGDKIELEFPELSAA